MSDYAKIQSWLKTLEEIQFFLQKQRNPLGDFAPVESKVDSENIP